MFTIIKVFLKHILTTEQYNNLRAFYWKKRKHNFLLNWKRELNRFVVLAVWYPSIYRKYAQEPIETDKIIFIQQNYDKLSDNFLLLYDMLDKYYTFKIKIHFLKETTSSSKEYRANCISLIKDLATAKYIFLNEGNNAIGRLPFRKETQIIQIWHACGAFKKFGFATADLIFGPTREVMNKYPFYRYYTLVSVSSPEVIWAYSDSMGLAKDKILPLGVSRTDVFFNNQFINNAKKKFEFFMPSSKGKKVILFAPTFRGRVKKATTATAFSVAQFFESLSDEYVLVIKHHPLVKTVPSIPEKYRNFAVDFTRVMDIEELLCVADICISDYSSLIFEYSLFERPMIFFAYDIDEYYDWRGFYYSYDELTPGPVFKTNREMIDYIKHINDRFDKEKVIAFKEKFMSACDGHSTERLLNTVFGVELQRYKKQPEEPLIFSPETVSSIDSDQTGALNPAEGLTLPSMDEIREKLLTVYPYLDGKQLIAYFPTVRNPKGYPPVSPYLKWPILWEYLDEKYAVLYSSDKKIETKYVPKKYQKNRFVSCKNLLTDTELVQVADIIIIDFYRDIARFCIIHKPTLIFLPDYRWYCSDETDYIQSTEFLRANGCFYESTEDLVPAIEDRRFSRLDPSCYLPVYKKISEHNPELLNMEEPQ